MNPNELENYKKKLEKIAVELETDFTATPDIINFEDRPSPEAEADEATAANEQAGIKDEIRSRLEDVRFALDRIADGDYGKCVRCGMDIEPEVLEAAPESRYCRKCKLELLV